tara:strand:- start:5282 stop:5407 length:126 start_codon:yes stop_codon:yes gene_type:complete
VIGQIGGTEQKLEQLFLAEAARGNVYAPLIAVFVLIMFMLR